MACPAILTGDQFLLRVLTHIDCQAQLIGSYGYSALGEPGSPASLVVSALLSLFIALFGIRMLFGPQPGARDVTYDVIRIGIVLTLAFSWPAFRTLIYDVTLQAPAEIAAAIVPDTASTVEAGFAGRLQGVDNAIVELTKLGTGRNTGALLDSAAPGGTFEGSALEDESAFGWTRFAYLSGVIGALALLRILAGLLLAIAPLAAGLLLFEQTRGLFSGWLRALVLSMLGALAVTTVLGVELAIVEPFLADALRLRALGYATPSAPIELLALTVAFALVQFGAIWFLSKAAFTRGCASFAGPGIARPAAALSTRLPFSAGGRGEIEVDRVRRISDHVETSMRREEGLASDRGHFRQLESSNAQTSVRNVSGQLAQQSERLGSSYRRGARRDSLSSKQRDDRL